MDCPLYHNESTAAICSNQAFQVAQSLTANTSCHLVPKPSVDNQHDNLICCRHTVQF